MNAPDEFRSCARAVEEACSALVEASPAALDRSAAALEGALHRLSTIRTAFAGNCENPDALAEAWRLQDAIRRAGALLETASRYHGGWTNLIAAQTAGYRPGGCPGEVAAAGRLWVEA